MPPVNLLIKPASGMCNMRCHYCFYHDITEKREQGSYGFMSEETLKNVLKKALDHADIACTIAFQGGEPTLAGLPFFEQAVKLSKEYNREKPGNTLRSFRPTAIAWDLNGRNFSPENIF